MPRSIWNQLPQRIETLVRSGEVIDRPTSAELDAALDDYETRLGFRIPASYREYMHWFGPGALSVWYQLAAPIPSQVPKRVARVYDIDKQREMIEDPEGFWASSVSPEVLRRLVLFASTEGGDWFFWDVTDVRSKAKHEYGIYGHAHGRDAGHVVLIAPSFKSFVTDVCLGKLYPFSDNEREPEWSFWPAWPSKKRRRGKSVS